MRCCILFSCVIFAASTTALGEIWVVNPEGTGDFPTIQTAVDSAGFGDIIELTDGTFTGDGNRDIYCENKTITVRSQSGKPELCIIDCEGSPADPHRGFRFVGSDPAGWGGGPDILVRGVTVTNGYTDDGDGGGGISADGGGEETYIAINDCVFTHNEAAYGGGGGIAGWELWQLSLRNCTVSGNTAGSGAGVLVSNVADGVVERTLIAFNQGEALDGSPILGCSDLFGNTGGDWVGQIAGQYGTNGNISEDPLFCDATNDDLSLHDDSPCAPSSPPNEECHLIGAQMVRCAAQPRACCFGETCQIMSVEECIDLGGHWVFGVDSCDPNPCPLFACCIGDSNVICELMTEEGCEVWGGQWSVGVEVCDPNPCPLFACCMGEFSESCMLTTEQGCVELGGSWLAGVYSCDPNPCVTACCYGEFHEVCQLRSEEGCAQLEGHWLGEIGSCDPNPCVAACCYGEFNENGAFIEKCEMRSAEGCAHLAGDWLEDVGSCDPNPCLAVCCYGEFHEICQLRSEQGCVLLAGDWLEDIGSCDPHPCSSVIHPGGTGHFPTIQAAVDAAASGFMVVLTEGVFTGEGNRDIDFQGKAITIRSEDENPVVCIIDCEGMGRGFDFYSGEGLDSRLAGVTIRGGATGSGAGIRCSGGSSPTIEGCIFEGGSAISGGGIACIGESAPLIRGCTFLSNWAEDRGGGLFCFAPTGLILENCTFWDNGAAEAGGGLYCMNYASPQLSNTIIAFSTHGGAVSCEGLGAPPVLSCTDLYGNEGGDWVGCIADQYQQNGNISEDPLFCDPEERNFRLQLNSPCVPFTPPNPECDLIGAWPVGCDPADIAEDVTVTLQLLLKPPSPNPFSSTTQIQFTVPATRPEESIVLSIHDVAGRGVRTYVRDAPRPGIHQVLWDGTDRSGNPVAAGIYLCRLRAGGNSLSRRVVLVR